MSDRVSWPRVLLRLLPRRFRDRFGDECGDVIQRLAADARTRGGRVRQAGYVTRELLALARLSLSLRGHRPVRRSTVKPRERAVMSSEWVQDFRWALRYSRRRPLLAAAIVLTMSLGIAVATVAFGLASAVLWRPLPFGSAERLFFVWEEIERDGTPAATRVTGARHAAWRDAAGGVASLALFGAAGFTMDTPTGAVTVRGVRVSANYFDTLGIRPAVGRTFSIDDGLPGRDRVVVLSRALWQEQFGGRPDVLGETLRLSGEPYTVIGVMPSAAFPAWPVNPAQVTLDPESRELWVPIPRTAALDQASRAHVFGVLARLDEGRSSTDLLDTLNGSAAAPDPHRATIEPLRQQFVAGARAPLLVLAGAAIAVLSIACSNLAALQASAFESRRAELSMRLALGAGAVRLVRQIIVESLVLIAAGTLCGGLIARAALAHVPKLLPASLPFLTIPALDGPSIAFAALLGLLATGLVSAWPVARLLTAPPSPRGTVAQERSAVYRVLVIAQIALAVALTSAAGLLGRSLRTVERQDPGFSPERLLVAQVGMPSRGEADAATLAAAERQLLSAIAARPGVEDVAAAYDHPLQANWTETPTVTGDTTTEDQRRQVDLRIVSPGYFDALGVEILEGRAPSERDTFAEPGVAVLNEAFARQLGGRVLGRRLVTGTPAAMFPGAAREFEIIGVVANERFRGLEQPAYPAFYLSTQQFPQSGSTLLVRTTEDPLARASDIRSAVRAIDTRITFDAVTSLERILGEQLVSRRVTTNVIEGFAAAALMLAALGVYGLLTVAIGSRRREIGVRLAVGASPASIARDVLRHGLQNAAAGVLAGGALALLTGRYLRGLLVGVTATDPVLLTLTAAVLLATAAAAAVIPAMRAASLDPSIVLRNE